MERMSEHTGLISSYQLLITAACTNTGDKMKGSRPKAAGRCPFVSRHSYVRLPLSLLIRWYGYRRIQSIQIIMRTLRASMCYGLVPVDYPYSLGDVVGKWVRITEPISSVPLLYQFFVFKITNVPINCWTERRRLLSYMNGIKIIWQVSL